MAKKIGLNARASASRWPAAARSAASTKSARCSRLSDSLDGLDFDDLDVYVGVSSGGFVAAALANGISPAQMYRLFIDDGAEAATLAVAFPASRVCANSRAAALSVPRLLAERPLSTCAHPWRGSALDALRRARPRDPHRRVRPSRDRRFPDPAVHAPETAPTISAQLPRQLFLVATNLDTGSSVTFGGAGADHVPISKALEASAALPGLFPPVRIDGGTTSTAHSTRRCMPRSRSTVACGCCCASTRWCRSMQARHRATAVASIEKLDQGGLPLVLAQTFRAIIHSRMKVGMEKYRAAVSGRRRRCCSSPTAKTPTCSSPTSSAMPIASGCARRRIAARAQACWRAQSVLAPLLATARCPLEPRASRRCAALDRRRAQRSATAADATARRTAGDTRSRAHARPSGGLARRGVRDLTPGARIENDGGTQTSAPHARAHPRDQPRAVQSRRRAARHDGGHRRRDEHQPGQPVLSFPQQGRDHRRAVRRARAAAGRRCSPRPPDGCADVEDLWLFLHLLFEAMWRLSIRLSRPGRDHVAQPQARVALRPPRRGAAGERCRSCVPTWSRRDAMRGIRAGNRGACRQCGAGRTYWMSYQQIASRSGVASRPASIAPHTRCCR